LSARLKVPVPLTKNNNKQNQGIEAKFNELILILNPNSQGGATGKNWNDTYDKIKEFLPRQHRIIFTKKANDGTNITRKLLKEGYRNIVAAILLLVATGRLTKLQMDFLLLKQRIDQPSTPQNLSLIPN
jgi:hypothetical protein